MAGWEGFGNDIANSFISNVWRVHDMTTAEKRRREDLALREKERRESLAREQRAQDLAAFTRQTERSQDRADRSTERRDASMERTLEREADERVRQRTRIDALPPAARLAFQTTIGKPTMVEKRVTVPGRRYGSAMNPEVVPDYESDKTVTVPEGPAADFASSYQKALEIASSQAAEKVAAEKAEREAEIAHRAAVLAENRRANDISAGAQKRAADQQIRMARGAELGMFLDKNPEREVPWVSEDKGFAEFVGPQTKKERPVIPEHLRSVPQEDIMGPHKEFSPYATNRGGANVTQINARQAAQSWRVRLRDAENVGRVMKAQDRALIKKVAVHAIAANTAIGEGDWQRVDSILEDYMAKTGVQNLEQAKTDLGLVGYKQE